MKVPTFVPDASVLLKWTLESQDEADSRKALELMQSWLAGKCRIVVPSFWIYEVGNILGLKQPALARQLLGILVGYKLEEEAISDLYGSILKLMSQVDVSFYDAAYHAIAMKHEGTFVTADKDYFQKAASLGHVTHLDEWRYGD